MNYFKPLRRKVGVVVLVMTCLMMIGWTRSATVFDSFDLPIGGIAASGVLSANRQIGLYFTTDKTEYRFPERPAWKEHKRETFEAMFPKRLGYDWDWRYGQFAWLRNSSGRVRVLATPFWSIVAPLSLLSAYLLLSKPRQKPSASKQDVHQ